MYALARRGWVLGTTAVVLLAAVALLTTTGWSAGDPVANGLGFLSNQQNPNGSWGDPSTTNFRDSAVVLETLRAFGETGIVPQRGLAWLSNSNARTHDDLARQIIAEAGAGSDTVDLTDDLLGGQNEESFNPASFNFPEGGWGLAPQYATDPLTTALALRALLAAGLPAGLTVVGAGVDAGPDIYTFEFPGNGSDLTVLVRELTGPLHLQLVTPSGTTITFGTISNPKKHLPPAGFEEPGTWTVKVFNDAGVPIAYSLETQFLADGFDVKRVSRGLRFLALTQSADGGWPASPGQDSHFMVTAEVLLALAAYGESFAPDTILAGGVEWLEGRQNGDGGFGSEAGVSTVYETALAILAINAVEPSSALLPAATDYLLQNQGSNGGWNDRPYDTALAIIALTASPPVVTPTPKLSPTPSSTGTATATPTATLTPTATATLTLTATVTPTATGTPTLTLTATATPTPTATATATATPTITLTPTFTATVTPTDTPTATATPTPKGPWGDANQDGNVLMTDALLIAQCVVGLIDCADINQTLADVNCENGVTMTDALLVAQFVVGLITEFPCKGGGGGAGAAASASVPVQPDLGKRLSSSLGTVEALLERVSEKAAAGEPYEDDLDQLISAWPRVVLGHRDLARQLERNKVEAAAAGQDGQVSWLDGLIADLESEIDDLDERLGELFDVRSDPGLAGRRATNALEQLRRGEAKSRVEEVGPRRSPDKAETKRAQPSSLDGGDASAFTAAASPPLVPGDLATPPECQDEAGAIPQEVVDLAASLGNSPVRIYEFVRNEFSFEIYFGSLKGCSATLQTHAGNDYDLATLLVSLLRASGHPARFVRGTVDIPPQDVSDWLGIQDADVANGLLNTGGITAIPFVDGTGEIVFYRVDRAWVNAYVPYGNYRGSPNDDTAPAWVPLDPAFKLHEFQPGIPNIANDVPFNRSDYLSSVKTELAFEFYQGQVRDHLRSTMPGSTLADVPYAGTVIPEEFGLLPATLPFDVVSLDAEFAEIPDSLHHKVNVTLTDLFGTLIQDSLVLPEVALQRRTVSFVAATPADQAAIDAAGGLENLVCSSVNLKPQLRLDGVVAVEGPAVPFCQPVSLKVGFVAPEDPVVDEVTHGDLRAGDHMALALDANQNSQALLDDRAAKLLEANTKIGTPDEDADDLTGELLNIAGVLHFLRNRQGEDAILDLFQYQSVRKVGEGLMTSSAEVDFLFDRPFSVTPGNLTMDLPRHVSGEFGIDGDDSEARELRRLLGLNGSAQEHATWEELTAIESVSTVKVLQLANDNGEPVHVKVAFNDPSFLCKDGNTASFTGCLTKAGLSSSVVTAIANALNAGNLITVPEADLCPVGCDLSLNDWFGTGYISEDPVDGTGQYIISGGLASERQVGGATTAPEGTVNAVIPLDAGRGAEALDGLPTHTIDAENIDDVLESVTLPQRLEQHLRTVVEDGASVAFSDVLLEVNGREGLVFRVEDSEMGETQFFLFDAIAGGSGTESEPNPEDPPPGTCGKPIDPCAAAGDPVNVANGNLIEQAADVRLRTAGLPMGLTRTYSSRAPFDGPFGFGWTHGYRSFLIENPDQSVVYFDSSGAEHLFTKNGTYDSPPGIFLTLTKEPTKFTLRTKDGLTSEFDLVDGKMLVVRDRNGNEQTFDYDPDGLTCSKSGVPGNLCTVTDEVANSLSFLYDGSDRIISVTDSTGRAWTYTYDADGNLASVTTPSDVDTPAATARYTYFESFPLEHNLKTITDPRERERSFRYYANDKTFQEIGPDIVEADATVTPGAATTFYYDIMPLPDMPLPARPDRVRTRVIDPRGNERIYTFDDNGFVTEIRQPDGTVIETTWDADGNRISVTDQLGHTTNFTYDGNGNLLESTDPLLNVTSFSYEPTFNQVETIIDPNRQTVGTPEAGAQCGPSGTGDGIDDDADLTPDDGCPSTIMGYDPDGNPITITDAQGAVTEMDFDDPARNLSATTGLLTRVTSALGVAGVENSTTFDYDALGRLVTTTDPLGNETALAYDPRGNVITSTAKPEPTEEQTTMFEYDLLDRLTKVTDADTPPGVTQYGYDLNGNLIQVIDAKNQITLFEYDEANRLQRTIDPVGEAETFRYDGNRNLIASTDRNGETIRFQYDALNRLVRKALPGNLVTTYGYDAVGNLTSVVDPDSVLTFTYDDLNRLNSASTAGSANQPNVALDYTYDPNDNRETMLDPTGTTRYDYDSLNRLTRLINPTNPDADPACPAAGSPVAGVACFDYDELSRRSELVLPNAVITSYDYDDESQLLDIAHQSGATKLSSFAYTYDGVGNRKTMDHERTAITVAPSLVYQYDELNRLVDATRPLPGDPVEAFQYDAVGNRMQRDGDTADAVLDDANRLLEDEQFSYDYDANGNLIEKVHKLTGGRTSYTYDAENQLIQIRLPGALGVATYRYDGLGRRIEKCLNGSCVRYVYDTEDILLEYDGSNTLQARYTHGPGIDEPLIMERDLDASGVFASDERFFYHADGLGSITDLTDDNGQVEQAYVYDAFGNIVAAVCGATTFTGIGATRAALGDPLVCLQNPYTYTSREFDAETGLYHYRARYYDATNGRFLSEDTQRAGLFNSQSLNPYPYVTNNPLRFVDPSGEIPLFVAIVFVWAIAVYYAVLPCLMHPLCPDVVQKLVEIAVKITRPLIEDLIEWAKGIPRRLEILQDKLAYYFSDEFVERFIRECQLQ